MRAEATEHRARQYGDRESGIDRKAPFWSLSRVRRASTLSRVPSEHRRIGCLLVLVVIVCPWCAV